MKIAIVVNELDIRGGTHKQVLRLCQYLEKNSIEYCIYTKHFDIEKTYPDFSKLNVKSTGASYDHREGYINKLLYRVYFSRVEGKQLANLIPKDVDIINIHDTGLYWFTKYICRRKGIKIVWQLNDLPYCFRKWESTYVESFHHKLYRAGYRQLVKKINTITVNVSKNRERVNSLLNKDAEVFYCGVDYNSHLFSHNFPKSKEYHLLSTGVFYERRNYETILYVLKDMVEEGYNIRLDIIGSTELCLSYYKKIESLIKELRIENKVEIWGQVDEKTYNFLYNQADIFLFVNINQSWGLAVFEAMSCGLPVIVSESVGAVELLQDGIDSFIVPPKDVRLIKEKIVLLLSDRNMYNKISKQAEMTVKKFTWDSLYCSKMLGLFYRL